MNSRWTCMPPLLACLLRRVLGPWSKQGTEVAGARSEGRGLCAEGVSERRGHG